MEYVIDPIITIATSYLPRYEVYDLRLVCKKFKELIDTYKIITGPRLIKDHPIFENKRLVLRVILNKEVYYTIYVTNGHDLAEIYDDDISLVKRVNIIDFYEVSVSKDQNGLKKIIMQPSQIGEVKSGIYIDNRGRKFHTYNETEDKIIIDYDLPKELADECPQLIDINDIDKMCRIYALDGIIHVYFTKDNAPLLIFPDKNIAEGR